MDWIIFTLTACAFICAGGLLLILFFRYRQWEAEQIRRARAWQKRSREILEDARAEIRRAGKGRNNG